VKRDEAAETPDQAMRALVEDVAARKRAVLDDARQDALEGQRSRGKLTARERVERLVDPGSFSELGQLAHPRSDAPLMSGVAAPADGIVVGRALVDGRPVVVVSYDFTVLGGSMGRINDEKFSRARQISLRNGIPLIMFLEGGGARINERMGSTTIRGHERFSDLGLLSGWAPIICGIVGPTYAGHANLAALSDYAIMVKGASLGLAGPRLVEAATGEVTTTEELGGSELHARRLGSIEREVATEDELIREIRRYLALMPLNAKHKPPRAQYERQGDETLPETVLELVPESATRAYDMRRLVRLLLDADSEVEVKPAFARNVVTSFGRIGGHVVGVVANNPQFVAGALDTNASDKMARFINICDCFNIPLVVLSDVPGYLVGTAAEQTNIVRHSMRPLWELGQVTVPILTIVVRKAYGLAYHTMGGAEFHPELMVCWPTAQVSPMGAEGAVNVIYGKSGTVPRSDWDALVRKFKELERPILAAEEFKIDDIIDPRDTRRVLLDTLDFIVDADHHSGHWRPPKKRGVAPA
jgi:propionyl-CoA carboxylase beta chain